MHTSMMISIRTTAAGRDSLLAQHNDDDLLHISVFCSEAGESALCTELSGGRRCTLSHKHEVSTVESELHSSRLSSEGMCSSFLFYITLSKPIQPHLVSFCKRKDLFYSKIKMTSTLLVCFQGCKKQNNGK